MLENLNKKFTLNNLFVGETIQYLKGGGLLAPNGKKSNLTPEQYKLVRTKAFKDWFGDWENNPKNASKVVDENGEPKVVWHNTFEKFTIFDKSKIKKTLNGFYFAYDEKDAFWFGYRAKPYFLNLKVVGVDGRITSLPNIKKQVVIFEPNNIKLADGTNTTFDGSNPDIRYEKGGKAKKQPRDLTSLLYFQDAYRGAEFYSLQSGDEYEEEIRKSDRWFELTQLNQKVRQLTPGEFEEFTKLSMSLLREEMEDGGDIRYENGGGLSLVEKIIRESISFDKTEISDKLGGFAEYVVYNKIFWDYRNSKDNQWDRILNTATKHNISKQEAYDLLLTEFTKEIIKRTNVIENDIILYRFLALVDGVNGLKDNLGSSWAYIDKEARGYPLGDWENKDIPKKEALGYGEYLLKGVFDIQDVDWVGTFNMYLIFQFGESEIKVKKGAKPKELYIIQVDKEDFVQKKDEPIHETSKELIVNTKKYKWQKLDETKYYAKRGTSIPTEFWGKEAVGVLIIARDTGRMLLLHRSLQVNEPLTWGMVSGRIDEGDSGQTALHKEIEEEIGVSVTDIYPSYVFKTDNFEFHNYIGFVDKEFRPDLNWENTDYKWCDVDSLPKPLHFGIRTLLENIDIKAEIKKLK